MPVRLSGQLSDPVPVMGFQEGRHTLEYLIRVQAAYHHRRRSLYHKGHNEGQRDYNPPYADQVHLHHKHGVSAAADNSVIGRHLIGHSHDYDAQYNQEGIRHIFGGRRQIIDPQQRDTDYKQDKPGYHTDYQKQPAASALHNA